LAQRNGFDTPSVWIGEEGDEYRERWKQRGMRTIGRYSEEYKESWRAFLAEQVRRPIEDIDAELRAIAEAEPPEEQRAPRRRRRRTAA
jgi:hypothetical protein